MTGSWTDAFPAPFLIAPILSREEALSDLSSPDLLIVDVRRTDYEGGTIKGSINLPAHSFYVNRGVLYDLCKRAGVKRVAFYCGKFWSFLIWDLWVMTAPCYVDGMTRVAYSIVSFGSTSPHRHSLYWLRQDRSLQWARSAVLRMVRRLHSREG
jgi:hypothetical protein